MAKKMYIGVGESARNIVNAYVGVDGKARKIIKGYVGVNGVARQFWPTKVWSDTLFPNEDAQTLWTAITKASYLEIEEEQVARIGETRIDLTAYSQPIQYTWDDTTGYAGVSTTNPIDLTNYSSIVVEYESDRDVDVRCLALRDVCDIGITASMDNNHYIESNTWKQGTLSLELDVTDIDGEYHISFWIAHTVKQEDLPEGEDYEEKSASVSKIYLVPKS